MPKSLIFLLIIVLGVFFLPSVFGVINDSKNVSVDTEEKDDLLIGMAQSKVVKYPEIEGNSPHKILLKSRRFVSKPGLDPNLEPRLSAMAKAKVQRAHVLIQFDHIPNKSERKTLKEKGVKLLSYIPNKAWTASIPIGRAKETAALKNVRWIGEILPEDKMAIRVKEKDFTNVTLNSDGTVNLSVVFFEDISLDKAFQVISDYSGLVVESSPLGNVLKVTIPIESISDLANDDSVMWINQFYQPEVDNDGSRAAIGVDVVQLAPYNLDGTGVIVGEWDAGHADSTHDDLEGRITFGDSASVHYHATHVAGTVLGNGTLSETRGGTPLQWRGMATNATLVSYQWWYSVPELYSDYNTAINTYGIDLSTNSWGYGYGGTYEEGSQALDNVTRGALGKPISILGSAGNSGPGWGTVRTPNSAKNMITVGATNSNDDSLTSWSSRGPAEGGGRLKPDVVAPGCQVGGDGGITSTYPGDTYAALCGTSMSTPATSGSVALTIQDYRSTQGVDPLPSTVKALLIHTAKDLGNAGPDFSYGYGRINVTKAIDLIRSDTIANNVILEDNITDGEYAMYDIAVLPGQPELKVTLVWDDYPGTLYAAKVLVNDLNLVVIGPTSTSYYPWVLDPDNPSNPATIGVDDTNNVEQVVITSPVGGIYRLTVNGSGVPYAPQSFSLVVSGGSLGASRKGIVALDKAKYSCSSTVGVTLVDADLNADNMTVENATVNMTSSTELTPEIINLTETGTNTAVFTGSINLATGVPITDGILQVAHGDTINATYYDADDGTGNSSYSIGTAIIDCVAPSITIISPQNTTYNMSSVVLSYSVNEPTSWEGYSLDEQPNVTLSGNTTLTNLSNGQHNLTVYGNDTVGNIGSSDIVFFSVAAPDIGVMPTEINLTLLQGEIENRTLTIGNDGLGLLEFNVSDEFGIRLTVATFDFNIPEILSDAADSDKQGGETYIEYPKFDNTTVEFGYLNLTGVKIAYDLTHNERNPPALNLMKSDLTSRGATIEYISTGPITPTLLDEYDILWLDEDWMETIPWTSDEKAAVEGWVRSGGGLIVHGDEPGATKYLTSLFGINYTDTYGTSGYTSNISTHYITQNVSSVYVDHPVDSLTTSSPAYTIVYDLGGKPTISVSEYGAGGVVVLGDDYLWDSIILLADNRVLANQAFDWLTIEGVPDWLSEFPTKGTLEAGDQTNITLTINTTGLNNGTYRRNIRIDSTDLDETPFFVPVNLNVIDITPPIVTIFSPQNVTYNSSLVALRYSVNERTYWVGYSLDAQLNVTLTGNTTLTNLSNGQHNLMVYAQDLGGNWNFSTVEFTVDTPAKFNDNYSDQGTDTDNDGLYNYLTIDVGVEVFKAGNYRVGGRLETYAGKYIDLVENETYLEVGSQSIQLNFKGLYIWLSKTSGQYKLRDLELYDENQTKLDWRYDAYTTQAYNYTQFQGLAEFNDVYQDYGLDTDNDTLFNYLTIEVGVNVSTAGNYRIRGELYDSNWNYLDYKYNYTYLSKGPQFINLNFDGIKIYQSKKDGPYKLRYLYLYDANYTKLDYRYDAYTTSEYNYTQFQKPPAEFTDEYSDYGLDTDNDTLYNYLVIEVGVNVTKAGYYEIYGHLHSSSEYNCYGSVWNYSYLDIGVHNVSLNFEGMGIYQTKYNGTFKLTSIQLYDESGKRLDYRYDAYTTSPYNYTQFQKPPAEFTDEYSDYGLDTDNDTLYNYLVIDVGVNVAKAGNYRVYGYLWKYEASGEEVLEINETLIRELVAKSNSSELPSPLQLLKQPKNHTLDESPVGSQEPLYKELWVYASNYTYLDTGSQNVSLNFDGITIHQSKINGPYNLYYLYLYDENWKRLDWRYDAYTTQPYNYTQFQKPPAEFTDEYSDYGLDTDNDTLYNYLVIEVGVNVTKAGNYRVGGELYDSNYNWIGYAYNYTFLNTSDNSTELSFDGMRIYKSKANGPYKLRWLYLDDENYKHLDYRYDAYTTSEYNYTQFQKPPAEFTDEYSDYGLDTDNDTLYNYLVIDVGINVSKAGYYRIYSTLWKNVGKMEISSPDLYQPKSEIINENIDNKDNSEGHALDSIKLQEEKYVLNHDLDQMPQRIRHELPPIPILPPKNELWIHADNYTYLNTGIQNVSLNFDGIKIYQSKVNGPYELYSVYLYDENGTWLDSKYQPYTTQVYNYTQFQTPLPKYNLEWLPPLNLNKTHKLGRTIPIRFNVTFLNGSFVYDESVLVIVFDPNGSVVFSATHGIVDGPVRINTKREYYSTKMHTGKDWTVGNYTIKVNFSNGYESGRMIKLGHPPAKITEKIHTQAGKNIPNTFSETGMWLRFDNVESGGNTTINKTNETLGGPPPSNFKVVSDYYDISTEATITEDVEICLLDLDVSPTSTLFHWESTKWKDITTSVDADLDVICGIVSGFSPFAAMEQEVVSPSPPGGGATGGDGGRGGGGGSSGMPTINKYWYSFYNVPVVYGKYAKPEDKDSAQIFANWVGGKVVREDELTGRDMKKNFVLIGGSYANSLTRDIMQNQSLKFRNTSKGDWVLANSTHTFEGKEKGLILIVESPWAENHFILIIAGNGREGTRAGAELLTDKNKYSKIRNALKIL